MARLRSQWAGLVFVPVLALACRPGSPEAPAEESPTPTRATPAAATSPLDAAIAAHWRAAQVEPVGPASDATYLRRVTLDLTGRIPTPEELEAFVADGARDKRARRVEALVHSEEFARHWADVYADLLMGGATKVPPGVERGTHEWLAQQLAGDAAWDAMTRQMLTATGTVDAEGPAGFVAVHGRNGRVEALTGATARVFLGLSIQCAQCHDHPTDERYTQRDFYALAAFYARTKPRFKKNPEGGRSLRIVDKRRGEMRLPTASDGPGLRSGARIEPAFLGEPYETRGQESRREALADAIVESPLFAKAAVGRVWTQLFGRGLVHPWDDLGAASDPDHPPLLDHLAADFVAHDYDLRALVSAIVLSDAYGRASRSAGAEGEAAKRRAAFAQFPVRPMTTQQLVRSLLVATGRKDATVEQRERAVARMTRAAKKAHLVELGDDEGLSADTFSGNVPQALFLLRGPLTMRGAQARGGTTLAALLAEHDDVDARLDAMMSLTVARKASPSERKRMAAYVRADADPAAAYEDLMHAVLTSSEFLTIH